MNIRKVIDWMNSRIRTGIDFDKAFGKQCVDVARDFMKYALEIEEHTGAVSGASELFTNYNSMPKEIKYFDKIGGAKNGEFGDIVVFSPTPTNKYGHVAVLIGYSGDNAIVLEQDGFDKDTVLSFGFRDARGILGFLRRKQ